MDGWEYYYVLTFANNLYKVLFYMLPLPHHLRIILYNFATSSQVRFILKSTSSWGFSKPFFKKPNTPVNKVEVVIQQTRLTWPQVQVWNVGQNMDGVRAHSTSQRDTSKQINKWRQECVWMVWWPCPAKVTWSWQGPLWKGMSDSFHRVLVVCGWLCVWACVCGEMACHWALL